MAWLFHLGKGRYSAVGRNPELSREAQQQETVSGHLELWKAPNQVRIPHLP